MRLLLVDDEEEFVLTLAERLNMRGIEADYAVTGEDAIKKAEERPFDVAVLDMRLPRMGGLALRESLKKVRPGMKFLFLTGYGTEEDFNSVSRSDGEYAYLVKPVEIETLMKAIQTVAEGGGYGN